MAIQLFGKQQFLNDAGAPLSGGKIYFYSPGTTTPKDTYSDADGLTANANPVSLNSRGEAAIWGTGSYDIKVTDASDVTIYTLDGINLGSDDLTFTQDGTGAVARTISSKLKEVVSVEDFGAVSDGTTDDATAVTAAEVASDFVRVNKDTKVSSTAGSLNGMFYGTGQIIDSAGEKRGRIFSALKAAPSSYGNKDSITTAFGGDLSAQPFTMEHRITGSDTLGTAAEIVTEGYMQYPETSPFYSYMFCQSGRTDNSNNGTGTANFYVKSINASPNGGVVAGITCYGSITQARTPSGPIDRSAITCIAGQTFANVSNSYLNTTEFHTNDNGYDVTGIGLVLSQRRENNTGANGAFWSGLRIQSNAGAAYVPVDTAISVVGKHIYGLDLTNCVSTTDGIVLPGNMTIALNGTGDGYTPSSGGTTNIKYNTSVSKIVVRVDGQDGLQLDGSGNAHIPSGSSWQVGGVDVVGDRVTGWSAATGTATRSTFATSSVSLSALAERVKALIDDLIAHGLIGA